MQMCMDTQQIMQILSKLKANEQVSLEPEFYTDLFKYEILCNLHICHSV